MTTRLKELGCALLLSPAIHFYGLRGTLFFAGCLVLYVAVHVARDTTTADALLAERRES